MGSELVNSDLPKDKKVSMCEIFWEAFPAYLTMGMTSDEYWNGDARLCRAYRKKREEELKLEDERLWRQGAYVYHALICVAPYFNSIKPQKPEEYIEPFSYTQDQARKAKAEQEQLNKATAAFQVWADNFNKARHNGIEQHPN